MPCFLRWPGQIPAGSVLNGIGSHIDMFPTLLAIAGDTDITKKLHEGHTVGSMTYKVHLDGYNIVPYLTGAVKESPRQAIFYFSDDGDVIAVRSGDWKYVWDGGSEELHNLASDPGESNDLLKEQPIVAASLKEKLARWEVDVKAPRLREFEPRA